MLRLIRHATLLLELRGQRLLVDPMLDHTGARPPVENTPNARRNPLVPLGAAVLVAHGLVAAGHVHDGQPPVAQAHRPVHEEPRPVRPPVMKDVAHGGQAPGIHVDPRVEAHDSDDSAH